MSKYTFYEAGRKIICVSSYAGRTVRGIAICSPDDGFDVETGRELAKARCDAKIASRRYANACKKNEEAKRLLEKAERYQDKMFRYEDESGEAELTAYEYLDELVERLG